MSMQVKKATEQIKNIITGAFNAAIAAGELPEAAIPDFIVEIPADVSHGDYATNAAMLGARAFRKAPRQIAEIISAHFDFAGSYIERSEIAGPGFINFFVSHSLFEDVLTEVAEKGEKYGRSDMGNGKRVLVEFVSANPTGPMHLGNARGGAIGDCLAAVLDMAGYYVEREFYVNDAGNQIEKFGLSLDIRYQQLFKGEDAVELPEDSYHGGDIIDHAKAFAEIYGDSYMDKDESERRKALVAFALPKNIAQMKTDIGKYRIEYDTWFLESTLHDSGAVKETIDILTEKGLTYEKDGAVWYKATDFGGEKDEVLIRKNGIPTYFAADIAYHRNKFSTRNFDTCINIWGADHHGHVARLKGAMDAVGLDGSKLDIVLMQLVKLLLDGQPVRMSKRTGKAIQLADLLYEVPCDAARFIFNMRDASSQMDFDIGVAVREDSQNPVYYWQYAHARICSIFRKAQESGIEFSGATKEQLALLTAPEEIELIRHIASLTGEVEDAAKEYAPSRMTRYCIDLASKFHKFYNACYVIEKDNADLTAARLALCDAARVCLKNVMTMLKVTVPEHMESK